MPKAKTHERAAAADDRGRQSLTQPATVPKSDIARRAYDLYLARGREDGHDVDDWLQSERELHGDPEC